MPTRKKKKLLKERRKQRERVALKMDLPGVSIADGNDSSMFSLVTINKAAVTQRPICMHIHTHQLTMDRVLNRFLERSFLFYFS